MAIFFIGTIVPLSVLIPITVGTIRFSKFPFYLRVIVVFALVSGITSATSTFLAKKGINNMPAFHFFTVATFILCSLFYKKALVSTKIEKFIVPILFIFLAFAICSTVLLQGFLELNTYTLSIETVTIIAYCLFLFYRLLGADISSLKKNAPLIWINTAFFLYFSGSLFLFLFPQFTTAPEWVYNMGWIIHGVLVLLMYIFISIAFIKYKAPK
jgi:hypothetical protein